MKPPRCRFTVDSSAGAAGRDVSGGVELAAGAGAGLKKAGTAFAGISVLASVSTHWRCTQTRSPLQSVSLEHPSSALLAPVANAIEARAMSCAVRIMFGCPRVTFVCVRYATILTQGAGVSKTDRFLAGRARTPARACSRSGRRDANFE